MKLSCIIPLYNCLPLTQAMLATLQATLPPGLDHEIILVDDGSSDGTREWLRTLRPPIRVLLNERNLGYAAANNRAAALARGHWLVLLNNDLELTPHWLEPMLAAAAALGPRTGLIGNVQRTVATGQIDHVGIFFNRKIKPEHHRDLPLRSALPARWAWCRVPAVTGACLLVERALFAAVNGFDEGYTNGCEDIDLALRLAARGRIHAVALRSTIRHHVSSSPGRKQRDEQNTHRLTQRWRPTLTSLAQRAWARHFLIEGWGSARTPLDWRDGACTLAYLAGLRRGAPPVVAAGVQAAAERELHRWQHLLAPPPPQADDSFAPPSSIPPGRAAGPSHHVTY